MMQKLLKFSAVFGSTALAMAFASTVAFADTTDAVNTGDHVVISGNSGSETNVNVSNSNNAVISQSSTTHANTGGNDATATLVESI